MIRGTALIFRGLRNWWVPRTTKPTARSKEPGAARCRV